MSDMNSIFSRHKVGITTQFIAIDVYDLSIEGGASKKTRRSNNLQMLEPKPPERQTGILPNRIDKHVVTN